MYTRARISVQPIANRNEKKKIQPKYNYQLNLLELVALFDPLELGDLFLVVLIQIRFGSVPDALFQPVDSVTLKNFTDSKTSEM